MPISHEHLTSASAGDAAQDKYSPQPVAHSTSIEASAAAKESAELSSALAAVSLKEVAAAPAAASAAPAPSTVVAPAAVASATASGAVVPVVPSSLDEPVKDVNGELINGGFKRGGAENGPDGVYDEVELEDMEYDESLDEYSYPCPCGDRFRIRKDDMLDGEDIARCASCSLLLRVIYDPEDLEEED